MAGEKVPTSQEGDLLWPGDVLELKYNLLIGSALWQGAWVGAIEQKLQANPFYDYKGYTYNGDNTLTFKVQIKPYLELVDKPGTYITVEQRAAGITTGTPMQQAGLTPLLMSGMILAAAVFIRGLFTWLSLSQITLSKSEDRKLIEAREAVMRNPNYTPEQKAEILKTIDPQPSNVVAASSAAVIVVLAVVGYLVWKGMR